MEELHKVRSKLTRMNELEGETQDNESLYQEWLRLKNELDDLLKPYGLEVIYNYIWRRYCIG